MGVREDLTWKEVKSAVIPVAKYNDNTKEFEKWSPALPKNHEFPTDKTYTARFSAKPEIKVLESAVAPVPAGYVKIIFDPTGEGSFEDTGDGIKKIFAVREDLNWGNVKNRLPKQALYKDDTKKFDRWEPALPADSDRIETNTHVALYKDEADIIPIFTPSAETPKGYIRASFINNHPSVANLNGACELKTVKNHVSHMLKKLELRDRTQAAILAWKVGFAQMSPEAMRYLVGEEPQPDQ